MPLVFLPPTHKSQNSEEDPRNLHFYNQASLSASRGHEVCPPPNICRAELILTQCKGCGWEALLKNMTVDQQPWTWRVSMGYQVVLAGV